MLRIGFALGCVTALVSLGLASACTSTMDDCNNTSSCPPSGGTTSGGSGGGAGKSSSGGNSGASGTASGGSTGGGESGSANGGTNSPGGGGSSAAGEAGAGGSGGVPMLPCDGACTAPKSICDEPTDTCVECLEEADCAAGAKKKCDTNAKACVACLASTDCPAATAAKCDGGACVKCTGNGDCAHIAGKGVCDTVAGECVQCTTSNDTACAGKSCNPLTDVCTTTPVGSRDYCEACVADSECVGGNKADPDARCVPMQFESVARTNGFCLRRFSKACTKPYFKMATDRQSLSGVAAEAYCGIDEGTTRCEAVLDLVASAPCSDGNDTSCGCAERDGDQKCIGAGAGGVCQTVLGVPNTCTIPCTSAVQCTTVTACSGAQPYCH